MKTIVIVGVLVASVALQSSLLGLRAGGNLAVNLVLVAVVFLALVYGPVTGMLAGTVGGWRRTPSPAASSASAGCRRRWSGFSSECSARSST